MYDRIYARVNLASVQSAHGMTSTDMFEIRMYYMASIDRYMACGGKLGDVNVYM